MFAGSTQESACIMQWPILPNTKHSITCALCVGICFHTWRSCGLERGRGRSASPRSVQRNGCLPYSASMHAVPAIGQAPMQSLSLRNRACKHI